MDLYVQIKDMAHEGLVRSNLANTLIKLRRYDEARKETARAIECMAPYGHAAMPWITWGILHDLEIAEGRQGAAEAARLKARDLYLNYRRDGGENYNTGGQLCYWFGRALKQESREAARAGLDKFAGDWGHFSTAQALVRALRAVLDGARDKTLADDEELYYEDAAEVLLILENI